MYNKFTGENEEQLRQEIAIIEELLDEQPDSKCKPCLDLDSVSLKHTPGCMDSLVCYNRLLLKNYRSNSEDIRQKCLGFLQQLEQIDNPRKSRYREIGECSLDALGGDSHRRGRTAQQIRDQ